MDFYELAKERYSCKGFDGRAISKEQLDAVLAAGRVAPTAKNNQPQRIYVAQSDAALAKVDKVTPCRYNCRTVLIVAYDINSVFTYPGGKQISGPEDAAIVATHMMLAAKANGVDSCWINNFDPEAVEKEFELPENEKVLMMLDLGFPAPTTKPLPNHTSKKELSETVTFI